MTAILDRVDKNSHTLSGEAEGLTANSPMSGHRPLPAPETEPALGSTRRIFENTLTQTANKDRQPESFSFKVFMDRFDGLRIPSSPLHEF